ncbi:unnamed protein product, partial [Discosporangium mesarthrocarpum]
TYVDNKETLILEDPTSTDEETWKLGACHPAGAGGCVGGGVGEGCLSEGNHTDKDMSSGSPGPASLGALAEEFLCKERAWERERAQLLTVINLQQQQIKRRQVATPPPATLLSSSTNVSSSSATSLYEGSGGMGSGGRGIRSWYRSEGVDGGRGSGKCRGKVVGGSVDAYCPQHQQEMHLPQHRPLGGGDPTCYQTTVVADVCPCTMGACVDDCFSFSSSERSKILSRVEHQRKQL